VYVYIALLRVLDLTYYSGQVSRVGGGKRS